MMMLYSLLSLLLLASESILAEDILVQQCGNQYDLSSLGRSDRYVLLSHEGFDEESRYENNIDCANTFLLGDKCEEMVVSCSYFDLAGRAGRQCRNGDFVMLNDNADIDRQRFCGNTPPLMPSKETRLRVLFRTNRRRRATGFKCFVHCSKQVQIARAISNSNDQNCYCGRVNRRRRIIGGTETEANEFPWQVALVLRGQEGLDAFFCAGVVLNRQWILTAAHCTDDFTKDDFDVLLGEHDFESESESLPVVRRRIKRFIDHPNYDPTSPNFDFSLLELEQPLDAFTRHIKPICMPTMDNDQIQNLIVTGWGVTELGVVSPVLRKVEVPVVPRPQCAFYIFNRIPGILVTENMICAGLINGGKDACQGDSGGPAIYQVGNAQQFYELAGVTSFGYGCAVEVAPGVYAYVRAVESWIRQYVTEDPTCPRIDSGMVGSPL